MEPIETLELIKKPPTEEILTEDRLKKCLEDGIKLKHYQGFEISGYLHLGNGILSAEKIKDFQKAGIETTIFLADYHTWINKKLGGDLSTIRKVAGGYFKEALKESLKIVGGDPEKVKFVLGSELYEKLGIDYLETLLKVSMNATLSRVKRSLTIMGRKESEALSFAQLVYPPMQVADIFALRVSLPHGGMDQRKAHVIAIEVGEKVAGYKPIAVHHHLLIGTHIGEEERQKILRAKREGNRELFEEGIIDIKMSKSKPYTAIFIHDKPEDIEAKIRKAYCPPTEVELNPVIELVKYVLFRGEFEIVNKKTNERKVYTSYSELEKDYIEGKIHPEDLKLSVSRKLIEFLEPARKYFLEGPGRKYLEEMEQIEITR